MGKILVGEVFSSKNQEKNEKLGEILKGFER